MAPATAHQKNKTCKKQFCSWDSHDSSSGASLQGDLLLPWICCQILGFSVEHISCLLSKSLYFFLWEAAHRYSITLTLFLQDNDGANKHSSWLRRKVWGCKVAEHRRYCLFVCLFIFKIHPRQQPFLPFFPLFFHYKQPIFPSLKIISTADQRIVSTPTKANNSHWKRMAAKMEENKYFKGG